MIHVGMAKTGTTHLQDFLALNSGLLEHRGLGYPKFLAESNHTKLVVGFGGRDASLRRRLGLTDDNDLALHRAELSAALSSAVAESHCDRWLFTSEYLSSRLVRPESVGRFRQWIGTWFDPVEIVIYLRRQDYTAPSAYSTFVKSGGCRPWGLTDLTGSYFNLADVVDRWRRVCGPPNVTVRPYLEPHSRNIDLIDDFLCTVDLPLDDSWQRPTKGANPRLAANAVEALRRANVADETSGRILTGSERRQRNERVIGAATGPGWSFPLDLMQQVCRHFEPDNRRLVETFDDPDGSWTNWLEQDPTGHPPDQPVAQPDQVSQLTSLAAEPAVPPRRRRLGRLRRP